MKIKVFYSFVWVFIGLLVLCSLAYVGFICEFPIYIYAPIAQLVGTIVGIVLLVKVIDIWDF